MDGALLLRISYEQNEELTDIQINNLLETSKVVQKLTKEYENNHFFNIFRLLCLSEIPYIERLPYSQKVLSYVSKNLATDFGFSYTRDIQYVVPCYNALLLEAYTRLGLAKSKEVQNALQWIKKYQVFERNQKTLWQHEGICKHGGCMGSIPCYIGIGKTIRALITYAQYTQFKDQEVNELITIGTSYMLKHNMLERLSSKKPISKHISDIMFPQAYMLSLTDLVYIIDKQDLWEHKGSEKLKKLVIEKICLDGGWKVDYIYSHKGYKTFETRRKDSKWLSYLYPPLEKIKPFNNN